MGADTRTCYGTLHPGGAVWENPSQEDAEAQSRGDGSIVVTWEAPEPRIMRLHRLDDESSLCWCPTCRPGEETTDHQEMKEILTCK